MVFKVPKTRPAYPDEFRREAVQMLRAGRTPRELGVPPVLRTHWDFRLEIKGLSSSCCAQPKVVHRATEGCAQDFSRAPAHASGARAAS